MKRESWSELPPNKPVCPSCKKTTWYVSRKVIRRTLTCRKCLNVFLYLDGDFGKCAVFPIGRFDSSLDLERRLNEYGKESNPKAPKS